MNKRLVELFAAIETARAASFAAYDEHTAACDAAMTAAYTDAAESTWATFAVASSAAIAASKALDAASAAFDAAFAAYEAAKYTIEKSQPPLNK